jgi:hypothetical protein
MALLRRFEELISCKHVNFVHDLITAIEVDLANVSV